jgi:hypothetical protein
MVVNANKELSIESPLLDVAPSGPHNNVKKRAAHLSTALKRYKEASLMGSIIPSSGLAERVSPAQQQVIDDGDNEFMKGYAAGSLAEYGFDPNKIDAMLREERYELQQRYIGSDRDNEKYYKKIQRRLGRQTLNRRRKK